VRVLCSEGNRPRYAIYVRFGQKAPAREARKMFREEGLRPLSQSEARPGTWNARQYRARLLRDGHAQGRALAVCRMLGPP
jgi:hypothetical protein